MRNIRPAFPRSLSRAFEAAFWTSMLGAVCLGLIKFSFLMGRIEHPRHALSPAFEHYTLLALIAAFGLLGLVLALQGFFSPLATRYEIGATELTVRSGMLWRETSTLPLIGITRVESVTGPLMRMFGLTDLRIYSTRTTPTPNGLAETVSVRLLGLRDGEEVRRYLLERRDTLHDSVLRGDLSVARTPQELQMERLTAALERVEQRLPRT